MTFRWTRLLAVAAILLLSWSTGLRSAHAAAPPAAPAPNSIGTVPADNQADAGSVSTAAPNDPVPMCNPPSNSFWWHCWGTPYSGPYTQAWIGPLEDDSQYGWHHNVHLQPRGENGYMDYMNLHLYYAGVVGQQEPMYQFRVYCSDTQPFSECKDWNGPTGQGALFSVSVYYCLGDGYPCADSVAADMLNCIYSSFACPFTNQSFVRSAFPGFNSLIYQKDGYGDQGTLQNAFCDALRYGNWPCSNY